MDRYFNAEVHEGQSCELFLVEGLPVASFVYNHTNFHNAPVVDVFHLNRAMLILFDASVRMRCLLYKRHRHIDVRTATNRNDFLSF